MTNRKVSDTTLILPSRYAASVDYYALLSSHRKVVIDTSTRFNKRQKETHRCTVADTHGVRSLTVPIEKPLTMTGPLGATSASLPMANGGMFIGKRSNQPMDARRSLNIMPMISPLSSLPPLPA